MRTFAPPVDASWVESLPDGHQGTWRTLDAMRYLVRQSYQAPFVRQTVGRILARQQPGTSPAAALFQVARDCIRYVEDPPGVERVADFQRTTEAGYGDCDDKATWLATALLAAGISARFAVQSFAGTTWDHVYVEFYDWNAGWLGKWVALDPTADGHGDTVVAEVGWRNALPATGYETRFEI